MWERIIQIFKKEMIQIFRDKRMRLLVFLPPIIQLVIFGYAATMDVKNISLALLDEDRTTVSRQFIDTFEAGEYFTVDALPLVSRRGRPPHGQRDRRRLYLYPEGV